ncbi:protein of unknown function [Georgfuchsia toluolica]|uniref:Urate oxidase N-terminal domain-containing protein n=1 Tax=Georgfuchsia toluolica TaxID=424218 RepID=A0A916N2G7_9PROT|nr:hypothetical protein [Georgfuchsia toluolica]CAG4883869.1 protein of unknown function [Georgfuchsia toluolica]
MEFITLGLGRWLHIMAGVMWVGLLYYFNFVQVAALAAAGKDNPPTGTGITKHVAPRALLYFRWSAVVTWLAGAMILGAALPKVFAFQGGRGCIRSASAPGLAPSCCSMYGY